MTDLGRMAVEGGPGPRRSGCFGKVSIPSGGAIFPTSHLINASALRRSLRPVTGD